MTNRILWLDNDSAYTMFHVSLLEKEGYDVTVATTVTEADQYLAQGRYDLLILDVMVPSKTAREEEAYPPNETEHGYRMGLVFYSKHKQILKDKNTQVLVHTVRLDKAIQDSFSKAGLELKYFSTKYELQDVSEFLEKVESLIGKPPKTATLENKSVVHPQPLTLEKN